MELIVRNVTEFVGDVELSDDITIVVLRCTRDNGSEFIQQRSGKRE